MVLLQVIRRHNYYKHYRAERQAHEQQVRVVVDRVRRSEPIALCDCGLPVALHHHLPLLLTLYPFPPQLEILVKRMDEEATHHTARLLAAEKARQAAVAQEAAEKAERARLEQVFLVPPRCRACSW